MKKYLPIRIFSIHFGYGWWWGKYFFFFGKKAAAFAIMPMSYHFNYCDYKSGKAIEDDEIYSWERRKKNENSKS